MNLRSAAISSRVSVGAGGRDVVRVGIERVRQLVGAGLVPRAQQLDDLVGQFAVVGDGIERFERGIERLAPRRDFGFVLGDMFVAAVAGRRRAIAPPAAGPSPSPTSVMKMTPKRDEQDQVAIGKGLAAGQRERQRQRRGQRHRAAHAGEGDHEHLRHDGIGSRSRRRLFNSRGR